MAETKKGKVTKTIATEAISYFDREVRSWLQKYMATVPDDHWTREAWFDRITSLAKPWIEERAGKLPPLVGAVVEKLVDYADMASGMKANATTGGAGTASTDAWINNFVKGAEKRMLAARDPQVEFEKLKLAFEVHKQFLEFVKAQTPPTPTPPTQAPVKPSTSLVSKAADFFEEFAAWRRK